MNIIKLIHDLFYIFKGVVKTMLTKKQKQLLVFINERVKEGAVSPSFEEMKHALGLKSKSGIHRLINALEERGFIRRLPHKARAIEVLKTPPQALENGSDMNVINLAERAIPPQTQIATQAVSASDDIPSLPLYGKIAAGTPIEALANNSDYVMVPPTMIGRGDYYALTVEGDSMVEAGIHDHDTVIIQRCDTAENGAIVVALVDEHEVTLKRLYRQGSEVALEPANQAYETRILPSNRVRIQGKLAGLIRQYH